MKKLYFAAAIAACAISANAQYTAATPYMEPTAANGQIFDIILADDNSINELAKLGKTVNDFRVNEETRFLYIWSETMTAGDASYPGVGWNDFQFDGYTALTVGTVGWSGGGFCMVKPGAGTPAGYLGVNVSHWNDNTRFHLAYGTFSGAVAPASIGLIIANKDGAETPAKVALGENFDDNGTIFPSIAPASKDEWQAVDISFADLKKINPAFAYQSSAEWTGNILSMLAGGVTGRSFAFDSIYFYTPADDSAVEGVEEDAIISIGNYSISSSVSGIEVYDAQGMLVAKTASNALGLDQLGNGIFFVKSGNSVKKFIK